jgi:hypothetical protein
MLSQGARSGLPGVLAGLAGGEGAAGELLLFILHWNGFKVFGLEDLAAIETFQVFDAVSSGDYLGTVVVTSKLHNQRFR